MEGRKGNGGLRGWMIRGCKGVDDGRAGKAVGL